MCTSNVSLRQSTLYGDRKRRKRDRALRTFRPESRARAVALEQRIGGGFLVAGVDEPSAVDEAAVGADDLAAHVPADRQVLAARYGEHRLLLPHADEIRRHFAVELFRSDEARRDIAADD